MPYTQTRLDREPVYARVPAFSTLRQRTSVTIPLSSSPSTRLLLRRLFVEAVEPYRGWIVLALVCMALVAGTTAATAKLMEPIVNDVFMSQDASLLWPVASMVLITFAIKGGAEYAQSVLMARVGLRIITDLQQRLFSHLMGMDTLFFTQNTTGTLVSRFLVDIHHMRGAVSNTLTSLGKDFLSVVGLIAVMFWQDWFLASIAFFVFPAAVWPIARIGRRMRAVTIDTQNHMGALTSALEQCFHGIRMVKSYCLERYEKGRIHALTEEIFSLVMRANCIRALSSPVMETLGGVAITAIILYGGHRVIDGVTTPGQFFSFITALMLAYQPMKNLAKLNASLEEGLAGAQRLFSLLDQHPSIIERPNASPLPKGSGTIQFHNASFSYGVEEPVVSDLTLEIPAGKTVALVGPSGAGKSTILNLIPRFYDVTTGCIKINGVDIRDVTLNSLHQAVAFVSQDIVLFDDTVWANIAFGNPTANEQQIKKAAQAAAAHDFICQLPRGYDTQVGQRGMNLSGGQRQRIAIARALLKNAPILLLDEATSALDVENERVIQTALETLMHSRTTVVIAHRLSTVRRADIICVVEKGRIIECGTHQDLLSRKGAYTRLHALHFHADPTSIEVPC